MSFIGGMMSGDKGANYNAQSANIQDPTTVQQAQTAYGQTQQGIGQQQAFINALGAQNGIANQSNVYNQMQGTANQYQGIANGTGPNPALAQLNQSTGQNIANQGALMAGQRGAGANVGLMARQAAMQGAATQQQAAGQGATLAAQQQIAGLQGLSSQQQAMGNIAGNQVANNAGAITNYNSMAQGQQANLLNSMNAQNNAHVSMTGNMNNTNESLANTNAQGQWAAMGSLANGAGKMSMAEGGEVDEPSFDSSSVSSGSAPSIGGPASSTNSGAAAWASGSSGGGGGGGGGGMGALMALMADGGPVSQTAQFIAGSVSGGSAPSIGGPSNSANGGLDTWSSSSQAKPATQTTQAPTPTGDMRGGSKMSTAMAKGGSVPALVSPGERYLPPQAVKQVAEGKKSPMKAGEKIPGKPAVPGARNSYANDTVPKTLQKGGIVLPRSVTQAKDPAKEAHNFVKALLARQGGLK